MITEIIILSPKFTFLYASTSAIKAPITEVAIFPVDVKISGNIRELSAAKGRALKKVLTLGEEVSTFINNGISLRKIVEHDNMITIKKIFWLVIFFTFFFFIE